MGKKDATLSCQIPLKHIQHPFVLPPPLFHAPSPPPTHRGHSYITPSTNLFAALISQRLTIRQLKSSFPAALKSNIKWQSPKALKAFQVEPPEVCQALEMPQFTLKDRKENYKSHRLEDFFLNHHSLLGVKSCVSIKGRSRATN